MRQRTRTHRIIRRARRIGFGAACIAVFVGMASLAGAEQGQPEGEPQGTDGPETVPPPPPEESTCDLTVIVRELALDGQCADPIDGAYVIASWRANSSVIERPATTGHSGAVEYKMLPCGPITVQVIKSGWETAGQNMSLQSAKQSAEICAKPEVSPD